MNYFAGFVCGLMIVYTIAFCTHTINSWRWEKMRASWPPEAEPMLRRAIETYGPEDYEVIRVEALFYECKGFVRYSEKLRARQHRADRRAGIVRGA